MLVALVTVMCVGVGFFLSKDTQFLMPGPLASAHGAIENCNACHTKSGTGKLSWLHGLVAGDRHADSKACLTCHKMPDTAFNAHSASADVLKQSTERLTKIAAETPAPQSAHAQSMAFPTDGVVAHGLYCATCHQEHQGTNFNLKKISNEQCRSCHIVKFDSFEGHHPKFENYPFTRRTQIIFDHAGHFGKHYPEIAGKDPARRIPETCSTCHNSSKDRRVMAVAPFEQTCTACHLDQITGKDRVSGPKGVAFLALPGLDLQALKKKNASIGEWPDASEARLTPFMKMMIGRNERGRALIKSLDRLDLQNLSRASNNQIKAVTNLVWEIKGLFYALIRGKASDVLGDLNIGSGARLSANLVADLTASIPQDVIISAQQQWLPNLGTEMASRPDTRDQEQSGWGTTITESRVVVDSETASIAKAGDPAQANWQTETKSAPDAVAAKGALAQPEGALEKADAANAKLDESESAKPSGSDARPATPTVSREAAESEAASKAKLNSQACIARVFGQCLLSKGSEAEAVRSNGTARQSDTAKPTPDSGEEKSSAGELPRALRAGLKEARQAAQPEGAAQKTDTTNARPGKDTLSASQPPQKKWADQADDLLLPTEEELRAMKEGTKGSERAAQPEGAAGKTDAANAKPVSAKAAAKPDANVPVPQARAAAPVISIKSDVDPESWAAYGGWYRQDYAIFYRPTGHKDKFIYSWLFLTGPRAPKGDTSPTASVFDFLTSKDAQGSCTKCHSVDDIQGKGRVVNFSPPSAESKLGRFTNFVHEPHLGILENRGCLTCHDLAKGRPYLDSYTQGNPQSFMSNFGVVSKDLCQTCHTSSKARQDCLTCHKYHVNGVSTPIMSTRLPAQ